MGVNLKLYLLPSYYSVLFSAFFFIEKQKIVSTFRRTFRSILSMGPVKGVTKVDIFSYFSNLSFFRRGFM